MKNNNVIQIKEKYKDCNGEIINYGDILKYLPAEEYEKTKNSPKRPFCMLVKYNNKKDLMYISGMDEFVEISEFQTYEDEINNTISSVEIFAHRAVYEGNLNYFRK